MKILHLSDTHGLHHRLKDMPAADVLVHTGDFTNNGTEEEVLDFLNWLDHGVGSTDHFLKFLYYTSFLTPHDPTSKFST